MTESKAVFFAFSGEAPKGSDKIFNIKGGYELWNLTKFTLDEFIKEIKIKIQPINDNVLKNYKVEELKTAYGLNEKLFKKTSWGLLIPDSIMEGHFSDAGALFILDLYSDAFLFPVFHASDFGISRTNPRYNKSDFFGNEYTQKYELFQTENFVEFYKTLLGESKYGNWYPEDQQNWSKEDWRLFTASYLFSGLSDYQLGKNPILWQRESTEMTIILEALFTADDSKNEELLYRLRKRITALLSWKFPEIEDDIKKLYDTRSKFVHGNFFKQIAKEKNGMYGGLTVDDFDTLDKHKRYVRLALVAYLNLYRLFKIDPSYFGGAKSVMDTIEKSIIDIELRKKITDETEKIFSLMPKTTN